MTKRVTAERSAPMLWRRFERHWCASSLGLMRKNSMVKFITRLLFALRQVYYGNGRLKAALLERHSSWHALIVFCWTTACEDMTIIPVSVEQMTAAIPHS
jgi:hypothetical protein